MTDDVYEVKPQPMISSQGEAQSLTYDWFKGKDGNVWLCARQPNAGDNVYVSDKNPKSQGFAGATLDFPIGGGNVIRLQGAWKTGPGGLFNQTGHDVRDKCHTVVVVSREREYLKGGRATMRGILYRDEGWKLGTYKRGDDIAQKIADDLGERVFIYRESPGGSMACMVQPQAEA